MDTQAKLKALSTKRPISWTETEKYKTNKNEEDIYINVGGSHTGIMCRF